MDYIPGVFSITIAPFSAPTCINISILLDNLVEDLESFSVALTSKAEVASVFAGTSVVVIAEDTGE